MEHLTANLVNHPRKKGRRFREGYDDLDRRLIDLIAGFEASGEDWTYQRLADAVSAQLHTTYHRVKRLRKIGVVAQPSASTHERAGKRGPAPKLEIDDKDRVIIEAVEARERSGEGWSSRSIARQLGMHHVTVNDRIIKLRALGRWPCGVHGRGKLAVIPHLDAERGHWVASFLPTLHEIISRLPLCVDLDRFEGNMIIYLMVMADQFDGDFEQFHAVAARRMRWKTSRATFQPYYRRGCKGFYEDDYPVSSSIISALDADDLMGEILSHLDGEEHDLVTHAIENHLTLTEAANRIGLNHKKATGLIARIRRKLALLAD
jgi:DNA-binding Lrp family transcriptional regulator